jgi:hypothetical protein
MALDGSVGEGVPSTTVPQVAFGMLRTHTVGVWSEGVGLCWSYLGTGKIAAADVILAYGQVAM